jgi:arginine-tRNA-protein transferase
MSPELYQELMDAGFRRSGRVVYQPVCRGCRQCVPLRVPIATFLASKSQRRCERRNADLDVTVAPQGPAEDEAYELYVRYQTGWHGANEPHSRAEFEEFLYDSPVRTLEFRYRDHAGRLLAVGICDVCDRSLSSVYFFFDPRESRRGLGTFGALCEIAYAGSRGIPHYYLGYHVAGCGPMEYKSQFRPYELLGTDGRWRVQMHDKALVSPGDPGAR